MNKVEKFIDSHWDECIKENRKDEDTLLGLPYPYTVPAVGHFDEMYYWDTYFTNKGLILSGRALQAKYNVENMFYFVEKYGHMLNGNRTYYLSHSQPPYLSIMVRDIYEYFGDKAWLRYAYTMLCKEYTFWTTERITKTGLSRYYCDITDEKAFSLAGDFAERIGYVPECDKIKLGRHYISICECGWDLDSRFGFEAYDFNPVDLNSLLYALEKNMAYFKKELGICDNNEWEEKAEQRKAVMSKLLDRGDGVLLDYNFEKNKHSLDFTTASFYPLFCGVADERQALAAKNALCELETQYGVLVNAKNSLPGSFQWGYPNGWACMQYIVFAGLERYGFHQDAVRIAEKYIALVEKVFDETGNLWEKYNVVDGSTNVCDEYKMPAMMGWSAGVYLAAKEFTAK